MLTLVLALAPALAAGPAPAEAPAAEPEPPPEIRVVGRPPRCQRRPGDPLDRVDLAAAALEPRQQVIKRDPGTGAWGLSVDDDPVTGPGVWQRAGTRLDQYVFRVPEDGTPLCIGARSRRSPGWGQLRQVVDAAPYRGKIVRVTFWAASRDAGRVWFWLASGRDYREGARREADMASESGEIEFRGTHRWTPVSLTMGPVRCDQAKLSFGALLDAPGDLWLYQPKLEVVGEDPRRAQRDCRAVQQRPPGDRD